MARPYAPLCGGLACDDDLLSERNLLLPYIAGWVTGPSCSQYFYCFERYTGVRTIARPRPGMLSRLCDTAFKLILDDVNDMLIGSLGQLSTH